MKECLYIYKKFNIVHTGNKREYKTCFFMKKCPINFILFPFSRTNYDLREPGQALIKYNLQG